MFVCTFTAIIGRGRKWEVPLPEEYIIGSYQERGIIDMPGSHECGILAIVTIVVG